MTSTRMSKLELFWGFISDMPAWISAGPPTILTHNPCRQTSEYFIQLDNIIWNSSQFSIRLVNMVQNIDRVVKSIKSKIELQHYTVSDPRIAQPIINNHLSLTFLLHVSTSTRSFTGRYTQRKTSTANYVKYVRV
jgi:hypothetical protein